MQLLQQDPSRNLATLVKVFIVLGVLLIAVAAVILIGNFLGLLSKFKSELYLFILGAIIAYLMAPLVNLLQRVTRQRWVAVLCSYLLVLAALAGFAVMLINPFISQAQSLVGNLHNPSSGSLGPLRQVRQDIARVQADFRASGQPGQSTKDDLAILAHHVTALTSPKTPTGAIQLPPSYIGPLLTQTRLAQTDYTQATAKSGPIDTALLARAVTAADAAATAASSADQKASSTPLVLLDLQTWLDNRGIQVDLHDKFGQALQQLNNQVASLVNNALGITLQAGNLLLSTVLAVIISIYFLSDGGRFVRWLIHLLPAHRRRRATYFVIHLDQILGSYLRAQLALALLAAVLDASGALVFGIPYPIVIFLSTFFLSLVPVIGPVILPFPPLLIALIFVPLPTPIFFLIWLLIGEQFATNIVGPRLQAHNVGIHPLEAMAAALAGLPLAGLLGAFFAVPIVAFAHIVARGVIHAHRHEEPAPPGDVPGGGKQVADAK
jgi:predicted PurR-regulated permease PerM